MTQTKIFFNLCSQSFLIQLVQHLLDQSLIIRSVSKHVWGSVGAEASLGPGPQKDFPGRVSVPPFSIARQTYAC